MIRVALLGAVLVAPLIAQGEVYTWRDGQGEVHYAQSPQDKRAHPLELAPPPGPRSRGL